MPSYIALLRAVNVGGRVYKMADLRDCLTKSGLTDVETYIQTGNVRFSTRVRSTSKVEKHVEETLRAGCGFDVPAIMFTPAELSEVFADAQAIPAPFGDGDGQRRYVTFFKEPPDAEAAAAVNAWDADGERAWVVGRAIHIWLNMPTMQAGFFGAFKKTLQPGTNRDIKVVRTLAERWGA